MPTAFSLSTIVPRLDSRLYPSSPPANSLLCLRGSGPRCTAALVRGMSILSNTCCSTARTCSSRRWSSGRLCTARVSAAIRRYVHAVLMTRYILARVGGVALRTWACSCGLVCWGAFSNSLVSWPTQCPQSTAVVCQRHDYCNRCLNIVPDVGEVACAIAKLGQFSSCRGHPRRPSAELPRE